MTVDKRQFISPCCIMIIGTPICTNYAKPELEQLGFQNIQTHYYFNNLSEQSHIDISPCGAR